MNLKPNINDTNDIKSIKSFKRFKSIQSPKNQKRLKLSHWIQRYNPIEVFQNNYVLDNSENSLAIVKDWMHGAPNQIWTIVECNRSKERPTLIVPGYKPNRSLGYLLATKLHQNEPFTYVY
jgi:hypothetical protein